MGKRRERAPVAERNCASAHSAHRCMQRMCRKYPVRRRLVCPNNAVVSASRAENSRGLYVTPAEFAGALHKRLRESRNVRFSGATKKKENNYRAGKCHVSESSVSRKCKRHLFFERGLYHISFFFILNTRTLSYVFL